MAPAAEGAADSTAARGAFGRVVFGFPLSSAGPESVPIPGVILALSATTGFQRSASGPVLIHNQSPRQSKEAALPRYSPIAAKGKSSGRAKNSSFTFRTI